MKITTFLVSLVFCATAHAGFTDLRGSFVSFWKSHFAAQPSANMDEYQENLVLTLMMVDLRIKSQVGERLPGQAARYFAGNQFEHDAFQFVAEALDMNLETHRESLTSLVENASANYEKHHDLHSADLFWELVFRQFQGYRAVEVREFQFSRVLQADLTKDELHLFQEIFGEMLSLISYEFREDAERVKAEVGLRGAHCESQLKETPRLPTPDTDPKP